MMNSLYCRYCGGFLEPQNSNIMLTSKPPKYAYVCTRCGKIEYVSELDEVLLGLSLPDTTTKSDQ